MLCPECNKNHRNSYTARNCYQKVHSEYAWAVIAEINGKTAIDPELNKRYIIMNNYYNSLPLPKRFQNGTV